MSTRISLPELKVASPCPARWEDMRGDDRRRFCDGCGKHVHNLAAMRDSDIAAIFDGQPICARIYRRADGTILTADCPVGVRLARTRVGRVVLRVAAAAFAVTATTAAALGATSTGERILRSTLAATIGRLSADAAPRLHLESGKLAPTTQATLGEAIATTQPVMMGIVAPPSSQPTE